MKAIAYKNGQKVALPEGIECTVIETAKGGILLDLSGQIPEMVLALAVKTDGTQQPGEVRLILSPMESGRLAVGVIRT